MPATGNLLLASEGSIVHRKIVWFIDVMEETIIRLAGVPVRFLCFTGKAVKYLRRYLPMDEAEGREADFTIDIRDMVLEETEMEEVLRNPLKEYSYLIEPASDALMTVDRCFLHGAAYVWKGRAWILSAPSGTGKSTQYRNLKELYKEEILCINGDKPCLEFRNDGTVMVHDSPWRGKEGWGTAGAAFPLAGLFFLSQASYNEIQKCTPAEGIIPLYNQFFSSRQEEKELHEISRLENILLKNIPIRFLANKGDMDSSRLLYQTMEQILEADLSHN